MALLHHLRHAGAREVDRPFEINVEPPVDDFDRLLVERVVAVAATRLVALYIYTIILWFISR